MGKRTREKIIYEAIRLFGTHGYERVSMRDIATAVGIKASSIYNHFEKKEDILDAAIDTYWEIFSSYHPTFDELKQMAYTHPAREVLQKFYFVYRSEHIMIMLYLLRVQFTEQFRNEKIRNLVFDTFLDNRIREIADLLEHLIKLGKILPRDPLALARMWTSVLSMSAMRAAHKIDMQLPDLVNFQDMEDFMINLICGEEDILF